MSLTRKRRPRTTVSLASEVLAAAREDAHRAGVSTSEFLSRCVEEVRQRAQKPSAAAEALLRDVDAASTPPEDATPQQAAALRVLRREWREAVIRSGGHLLAADATRYSREASRLCGLVTPRRASKPDAEGNGRITYEDRLFALIKAKPAADAVPVERPSGFAGAARLPRRPKPAALQQPIASSIRPGTRQAAASSSVASSTRPAPAAEPEPHWTVRRPGESPSAWRRRITEETQRQRRDASPGAAQGTARSGGSPGAGGAVEVSGDWPIVDALRRSTDGHARWL